MRWWLDGSEGLWRGTDGCGGEGESRNIGPLGRRCGSQGGDAVRHFAANVGHGLAAEEVGQVGADGGADAGIHGGDRPAGWQRGPTQ